MEAAVAPVRDAFEPMQCAALVNVLPGQVASSRASSLETQRAVNIAARGESHRTCAHKSELAVNHKRSASDRPKIHASRFETCARRMPSQAPPTAHAKASAAPSAVFSRSVIDEPVDLSCAAPEWVRLPDSWLYAGAGRSSDSGAGAVAAGVEGWPVIKYALRTRVPRTPRIGLTQRPGATGSREFFSRANGPCPRQPPHRTLSSSFLSYGRTRHLRRARSQRRKDRIPRQFTIGALCGLDVRFLRRCRLSPARLAWTSRSGRSRFATVRLGACSVQLADRPDSPLRTRSGQRAGTGRRHPDLAAEDGGQVALVHKSGLWPQAGG